MNWAILTEEATEHRVLPKKKKVMVTTALILKVVVTLVLVCALALTVNKVEEYKAKTSVIPIPFKESMDLLNVPVVTFTNNNVKLHFLLDTGSDSSYIRKEILDALVVKSKDDTAAPINTGGGSVQSEGLVTLDIFYKNQQFENTFEVADMTSMWDEATKNTQITIHGILGSVFFNRYKYQIDFEELVAYSKK